MNILQNRIDSFKNGSVKWPYTDKQQYPKIDTYAKAGFYFVRRPKTPDSIRCFLCDKDIGNWKGSQSPFSRHAKESPNCPWNVLNFPDANNKTLLVKQKDPSSQPRGSVMRAARLATFNNHNYWPPNKGLLSKSKKYPAASKLADAGFLFSPTIEQTARIKCPYCKITIAEPEKHSNLLHEHEELSGECLFFEPTHHIRATKNRRDTIGSIKSSESFKTANSELEEESMDLETDYSLYEPSFVESTKKKSKSKESDAEDEMDNNESKTSKQSTKTTKAKQADPIKVVRRRKVSETAATSGGKRKREESNNEKSIKKGEDDSIWNIEQTFTPTSTVRKPVITFGNKKSRVLPSSTRSGANSIDIFANLKSNPIAKPGEDKRRKDSDPSKKSLIEVPSLTKTRRKLLDVPKPVTEKTTVKDSTKNSIKPPNSSKLIVNIPPSLNEDPKSDPTDIPPKKNSTDSPISIENIEPAITKPYRDKGKGRAVEFNLSSPPVSTVKKPISLSKSKKLKPQDSTAVSFDGSDAPILKGPLPTGINNPIIPIALSEATYNQFSSSSSHKRTSIPSPTTETKQSDPAPAEDMSIDEVIKPENSLSELSEAVVLMETTPPMDLMEGVETESPEKTTLETRNRTPTPPPPPPPPTSNPIISTPPRTLMKPTTPRTTGRPFSFMQSTPNHESHLVNAFDIFGDCPMSPIGPISTTTVAHQSIYQDTPVMIQNGRTRHVIMKEPGGTGKLIHNPSAALPPPLDINNIQPAHITEKQKKMKVEEYIQGLFEQKIEDIKEYGLNEIKKIEAASEEIKRKLTAAMEH